MHTRAHQDPCKTLNDTTTDTFTMVDEIRKAIVHAVTARRAAAVFSSLYGMVTAFVL